MSFLTPFLVGSTATATTAATAGLFGAEGAVTLGGALSGASTILGLGGSIASAKAQTAAAKANQKQLEYNAGQEQAVAQREAEARRHKADLMISRAIAVGAASGAGTSGIEGIVRGIAEEGEEAAGYAMYEGGEKAAGMRYQGAVGVANAKKSARATILGGIANTGMSLAGRFAPSAAPGITAGYEGTWTSAGPFDGRTYNKQIWD